MKVTLVVCAKSWRRQNPEARHIQLHFYKDVVKEYYQRPHKCNVPKISSIKRKSFSNWLIEFEQDLSELYASVCKYLDEADSECHMYSYNAFEMKEDFYKYVYMHSTNALK